MHRCSIGLILSKYCMPSVNMRASDVKIICGNILLIVHTKMAKYSSVNWHHLSCVSYDFDFYDDLS